MGEKLLEILKKNIDEKGLAKDVILEIVKPALIEYAAKTENKIDDMAVEVVIGAIEKALA